MGYKKLSDGTWEQPTEALSRVLLRRAANWVAGGIVAVAAATSIGFGIKEAVQSNFAQPGEQTEHDRLGGAALLLIFGAAVGAGGGLIVGVRVAKDENSLEKIRKDVADGAVVIKGEPVVLNRYAANLNDQTVSAAPR
jgi:hypothetical protein